MTDVLVFDDDPFIGDLVSDLLRGMGLTVEYYENSSGVVQSVINAGCRLVILDVMMPGMDGLSACRALRGNPATRHVKVAILTAKDFAKDREAAALYGADLFINKPFEAAEFSRQVSQLLDKPVEAVCPSPPLAASLLSGGMVLETIEGWIVLDAGRGLQEWMLKHQQPPKTCWALLTRYEPEAIQEVASLGLLLKAGARLNLAGPEDSLGSLEQMAARISQAAGAEAKSIPMIYPQKEGEYLLSPQIRGTCQYTLYPGTAMAYRLELFGRSLVYCPANEVDLMRTRWNQHEITKFYRFIRKVNTLAHGFWRSQDEPETGGEGSHCAWEPVMDLAAGCEVGQLILTPQREMDLELIKAKADERRASKGYSLRCAVPRIPCDCLL